ncbi:MAG TPA: hypothetical protein VNM22_19370 [Candidatus Limnocylindrales bacterium]|nr:hypothetical protein [Candidatus Limnocylindrales bacterium]
MVRPTPCVLYPTGFPQAKASLRKSPPPVGAQGKRTTSHLIVEMITAEKNRLQQATPAIAARKKEPINWIKRQQYRTGRLIYSKPSKTI